MDQTLEYLLNKIEDERMAISESLSDGSPRNYEEYKYAVGTLRGLLMAQSIINDLAKRMENSDE